METTFSRKIVAVDDSTIILKTVEKMLEDKYEVHSFSLATRALSFLKLAENKPDLIILDIEMPEMDGYELLTKIKENEHLDTVPVIFLTSNKDKASVLKAVENGAKDYVIKPLDKEVLLTKILVLLNSSEESDN